MLQIKNTLGGGKPEGLYAWKKNNREITTTNKEKITKLTADTTLGAYGGTVYYSTSYTYDESTGKYTLTNPNSFTPTYSGGSSLANGNYVMYNTISSDVMYQTSTYSGSTSSHMTYIGGDGKGNVYIGSASGYGYPTKKYERVIKEVITDSFLGYIVSDKETAYPDGGEKGGYYYEKVDGVQIGTSGYTKFAIDTITLASDTNIASNNITIPHSLGVTPKLVILITPVKTGGYYISLVSIINDPNSTTKYRSSVTVNSTDSNSMRIYENYLNTTITDTQISFNSNGYNYKIASETSTLITMA